MSIWTGLDRWKVMPGLIDFSQIDPRDMGDNDLMTISGVGGGSGDTLSRKLMGTATSSTWGTLCNNLLVPDIVTFEHHTGIPCYLQHIPATATTRAKIKCFIGVYVPPKKGRPPTGAVWTAEDQT